MAWSPNVFFSLGQMLVSPLAFWLPQWRWLMLSMQLFGMLLFVYWPCLLESPRWLATQGRAKDAHRVLCSIAASNGRPDPQAPPLQQSVMIDGEASKRHEDTG